MHANKKRIRAEVCKMSRHQRRSVKKQNKKLVRPGMFRTYREPDPYYVQQGSGFWFAYRADGGGQDRGPEQLGTFLTQEEAEAALRKKRKK